MKKITVFFCLVLGSVCIYAQGTKTRVRIDIRPLKGESMYFNINSENMEIQKLKPNAEGVFEYTDSLDQPIDASLSIDEPVKGSLTLYLEPGDDLTIKTNFKDSTTFTGKGSENATVLKNLTDIYTSNYLKLDATKVAPKVLFEQMAQMNKANLDFLDANKAKVTKSFYDFQRIKYFYDGLSMELMYPYMIGPALGKKLSEVQPEDFMQKNEAIVFDYELLKYASYKRFFSGVYPVYLRYMHMQNLGLTDSIPNQTDEEKRKMEYELSKTQLKGKFRELAMFSSAQRLLENAKDVRPYQPLIQQFAADGGSEEKKAELERLYDQALKLSAGNVPPPFELDDINGKKVSLKDFAGKVVYIDFWASWCAPCRNEMKNGSPRLHAKFADNKDLVFLYISIDDSEEKWRKAIDDDKIEGVHLLSKGGMKSVVSKAFNITGIPRYVIIGRDGKIVDNDASRPSEEVTYEQLNKILQGG